jgi:uncharacterized protein YprB with RNaseH-like and TPR domain
MKSVVLDIETSDLAAVGAGFMLCAVLREEGDWSPCKAFRYDSFKCDPGNEKTMLESMLVELSQYDMIIGHNIEKFDIPYLKSRALVLGVPFNLHPLTYDTLKAFRRLGYLSRPNGFGKPSAGLGIVADMLGVTSDDNAKTGIYPRAHWKAVWQIGKEREEALDEIVDHCKRDVCLNYEVFKVLWANDIGVNLRKLR